jgi:hypothetical protein
LRSLAVFGPAGATGIFAFMSDHATLVSAGGKAGSLWLGGHPFNPSLRATFFHLL